MTYRNLLIVFVVSGLWHGANWTFILWGLLHGVYLVVEKLAKRQKKSHPEGVFAKIKIPMVIQQIVTFVLVLVAWVLFRANNIGEAAYIFSHLSLGNTLSMFRDGHLSFGLDNQDIILLAGCVLWLFASDGYRYYKRKERIIENDVAQGVSIVLLTVFVLIFGYYGLYEPSTFIYFQF